MQALVRERTRMAKGRRGTLPAVGSEVAALCPPSSDEEEEARIERREPSAMSSEPSPTGKLYTPTPEGSSRLSGSLDEEPADEAPAGRPPFDPL